MVDICAGEDGQNRPGRHVQIVKFQEGFFLSGLLQVPATFQIPFRSLSRPSQVFFRSISRKSLEKDPKMTWQGSNCDSRRARRTPEKDLVSAMPLPRLSAVTAHNCVWFHRGNWKDALQRWIEPQNQKIEIAEYRKMPKDEANKTNRNCGLFQNQSSQIRTQDLVKWDVEWEVNVATMHGCNQNLGRGQVACECPILTEFKKQGFCSLFLWVRWKVLSLLDHRTESFRLWTNVIAKHCQMLIGHANGPQVPLNGLAFSVFFLSYFPTSLVRLGFPPWTSAEIPPKPP